MAVAVPPRAEGRLPREEGAASKGVPVTTRGGAPVPVRKKRTTAKTVNRGGARPSKDSEGRHRLLSFTPAEEGWEYLNWQEKKTTSEAKKGKGDIGDRSSTA